MRLTYKNKVLTAREKIAIEELKAEMILEAMNRCYVCGEYFPSSKLQMAHVLSKSKNNIRVYGYEVVHHRKGIRITCAEHNSAVMINTSKTELVKEHVAMIKEDLNNEII